MYKLGKLFALVSVLPLISSASSSSYESAALWRTAMQQAGYQVVSIAQTNADALFVSCVASCVQYDWGKLDNYDNVPRDPREWIQLLPGTSIYGFGTALRLQDSEQAGLMFASGDRQIGQPFTTITTLNNGVLYSGFFGSATGQAVTDLYIGYPPGSTNPGSTSSGDTFSIDSILFAVRPDTVLVPEPGSILYLALAFAAFALLRLSRPRTNER